MSGGAGMWRAEAIETLWLYRLSLLIFSILRYVIGGRTPL